MGTEDFSSVEIRDLLKKIKKYLLEWLVQHIKGVDQVLEMVKRVKVSDILLVAREIFSPEKIKIALVGDFRGGDK